VSNALASQAQYQKAQPNLGQARVDPRRGGRRDEPVAAAIAAAMLGSYSAAFAPLDAQINF
jgi:hypothetical protein